MLIPLTVLAALVPEGHIAPNDPRAKLAVPVGILIFIGSIYLLLRSNLGSKRAYLVLSVSWWGFLTVLSAMWAFGAPGTPAGGGPLSLPGQPIDEYEPKWVAFAQDSTLGTDPRFDIVQQYPQAFQAVPPAFAGRAAGGADEIKNFFSGFDETSPYSNVIESTWVPVTDQIGYAMSEDERGFPIIGVPYVPTYQLATLPEDAPEGAVPPLTENGDTPADDGSNIAPPGTEVGAPVPGAEPVVLFGYFDRGNPLFPSYVVFGIIVAVFVFHVALLALDERREARERAAEPDEEERSAPVPA
jgi:hypothetical protein